MVVRLLILAIVLIAAHASAEAPPTLRLEVNPKQGTMRDIFVLSVSVEGLGDGSAPRLTGGEDFKISAIGSQVEMVGTLHQQKFRSVFRFQLIPKRVGTLRTPGAEIAVGATRVVAEPTSVDVKEAIATQDAPKDVFVVQSVDRDRVFIGEQVLHRIELSSSRDLLRPQFTNLNFDDFVTQQLSQEDPFERSIGGTKFQILRARRALYPLHEGVIELPPISVKTSVLIAKMVRYPALGGMLSLQTVERVPEDRTLQSNALKLRVRALPPRPASYQGWGLHAPIVGVTDMRGGLDRSALATGESATLTINVSSTGNIQGLQTPPLKSTASFRIYQERTTQQVEEHLNQVITSKTFVVSIVPLAPGLHALPEIALDYFDPVLERYQRTSLGTLSFSATGASLTQPTRQQLQTSSAIGEKVKEVPHSSPPEVQGLREEGLRDMLLRMVSPGTLLMGILGCGLLAFLAYVLLSPKRTIPAWQGTSEELQASFIEELAHVLGLSPHAGYEALRAGVRRSFSDTADAFEYCVLLDQLEESKGKPSEGVLKHLERIVPVLRLQSATQSHDNARPGATKV